MKLRVGTWNIATGRRMKSAGRFDYFEEEDVEYFAKRINELNIDILCLQESHANQSDSLTRRLADMTGFTYVFDVPGAPSHVDPNYKLSDAILSKYPFTETGAERLPYPQFELKFNHNGKVVPPHDRYLVWARIDGFMAATTHTEPLGAFGRSYEEGVGKEFASQVDTFAVNHLDTPLLFAADFNIEHIETALPTLLSSFNLVELLPNTPTKPHGGRPDHILASREWHFMDSGIEPTESDHYLCWADVNLVR
jgi:endonuclease/exonuclease/phosphatase family metal-dependent hydrolase